MATRDLPSPELLRKLLRYEPETGKLFWIGRGGKQAFVGKCEYGYHVGRIKRRRCRAHRVAWAIVHGEWPQGQIDHINGLRDDNRLANLRVVTSRENALNQKLNAGNKSGALGVCRHKATGKWQAKISIDKRLKHLGLFDNLEDAIRVRKEAEARYGYHPNHGKIVEVDDIRAIRRLERQNDSTEYAEQV